VRFGKAFVLETSASYGAELRRSQKAEGGVRRSVLLELGLPLAMLGSSTPPRNIVAPYPIWRAHVSRSASFS
jgi:hypothetical protein